jgi:hypothetical protein
VVVSNPNRPSKQSKLQSRENPIKRMERLDGLIIVNQMQKIRLCQTVKISIGKVSRKIATFFA